MTVTLLSLMLAPALSAPFDGPATEMRYTGSLAQTSRDGGESPARKFELYCLVIKGDGAARKLAYLIDEGGDGWAWPERYGVVSLDADNHPSGPRRPQLLQTHDGVPSPVALRMPLFEDFSKLKEGAEWTEGKHSYSVQRRKKVQDYDCWQVEAATNFGRDQVLQVDATTGLLVSAERKLTLGRGVPYVLKMQLDSVKTLAAEDLARYQQPLATLVKLQEEMNRSETETKPELTEGQLKSAAAVVSKLEKEAADTPFSRVAAAVAKDVKSQSQRAGDVESLAKKFEGEAAPAWSLKSLGGNPIDPDEYKGKIVVLHFFKYHGEPLQEPYGQVGYLDFLNNKRKKLGVQVYGVAVDERFADPAQAPAASRQVRRFIETMNLGYPVTSDGGALLQKFGDPRRVGAKLPLWVVIGPDGKIVHYKAGFYEIKPDEGLKQLDEILIPLIRKLRAAEKSE